MKYIKTLLLSILILSVFSAAEAGGCRFSVSVIPIKVTEFLNSNIPQLKGFPKLINDKTDNSIYEQFKKLGHRVVQIHRPGYQPSKANQERISIFHSERGDKGADFIKKFCMSQTKDSDELEINVLLTFVRNGQESIAGQPKIQFAMECYYVSLSEPEGHFWNSEQKTTLFHRSKDLNLEIISPQQISGAIDEAVAEFINDYNDNNFTCE